MAILCFNTERSISVKKFFRQEDNAIVHVHVIHQNEDPKIHQVKWSSHYLLNGIDNLILNNLENFRSRA